MTFIDLTEAFPEEDGIFRVMVDSVHEKSYESMAVWRAEKGFELIDGKLEDDSYIFSWWVNDNIR